MVVTKRYLWQCLDPLHVGTGGYRLGRVDNTVVRDPATALPIIPGSSLAGVIRNNAAIRFNNGRCAGKHDDTVQEGDPQKNIHCKKPTCPICQTFGYTVKSEAKQGTVFFHDGTLALFPVYSNAGPVWLATETILAEIFDVPVSPKPGSANVVLRNAMLERLPSVGDKRRIALGWLFLEATAGEFGKGNVLWGAVDEKIGGRIIVVDEASLTAVVNMNMDVRTSVSIDPKTGAAAGGALFTYEAVPRAAFFAADVVFKDTETRYENTEQTENARVSAEEIVGGAVELMPALGLGGMSTRGFGRVRKLTEVEVSVNG